MRDGGRPIVLARAAPLLLMTLMLPAPAMASSPTGPYLPPAPVAVDQSPYAEPTLAVSPTDPNLLVGGAIALGGGGPRIVAFRSTDAGANWSERSMSVPGFEFGYDPAAAFFSPRGVAFSEVVVPPGSSCGQVASVEGGTVAVFSSSDSGASWSKPTIVRDDRGTPVFADKPIIAADPSNGNVYLAWSQASTATGASFCQAIPSSNQLLVAVSHDGGRSFGPPVEVAAPGYPTAFGAAMSVTPDGKLFVAFEASRRDTSPVQASIYVAVSSDQGKSFSRSRRIGPAIEPTVPRGANLYPTSWPTIATSADGTVTVAWASGAADTRIMWSRRPASTGRFSPPRTLSAPPGEDLMPALGPGPVLGYLAFNDGSETPMVTVGDPSRFAAPVRAGRPGQAASPDELGEYLGVATVLGRVSMLWPQVRDDRQVAMFARTHLRSPEATSRTPSPGSGSPTTASPNVTTPPPSGTGTPSAEGSGGGNRFAVIASLLVLVLLAVAVTRLASNHGGRHRG